MEKKRFIKDYKEGERVLDLFWVRKKELSMTKEKKPYLALTLTDVSGEIEGRVWEQAEEFAALFKQNDYLKIIGQITSFNGNLQVKVEHLSVIPPEEVALKDFLPHTKRNIDEMVEELKGLIESLNNPWLKQLLRKIFLEDQAFLQRFKTCPGAKKLHHAYVGGLLEHTLSAAGFAKLIASYYPAIHQDLLIAGVLCHDIGKVEELDPMTFEYTDEGSLQGHLVMGYRRVAEAIQSFPEFPGEIERQLLHMILSHHGELEYGSPKKPQTREAFVLHTIENFDAKMEAFQSLEDKMTSETTWSDKAFIFDNQRIYFRKIEP